MRPQICVLRRFMNPGFVRARSNISGLKWSPRYSRALLA
jgi:hypothetical protein